MKTILPNGWYDILKWVSVIALPALAVLVGVLGKTWGMPDVDKIVITINAVGVFIGALIGVSTAQYNRSNGNG